MSPRQVAIGIAERYNTNNPFDIARERNIGILYEPMKTTYGFYVRYRRFQNIILNNALSEELQRFVCAHELAHSILHADLNVPKLTRYTMFSRDKFEIQANTFAVELLLPDGFLREYADCSIYQLAASVGVPKEFIELKRCASRV
jgi:Zn-dependent peptidase ImmA (M78 family)